MIRRFLGPLPALFLLTGTAWAADNRPNVILIMTDDQGYGDLGVHGNPIIKTPVLDRFARESVEIDPFYVSPVCAPTRASLMTGRYNYRTGVTDTWLGRAMMHADETTIAEVLRDAGYHTGIFGKWHLGDSYPMRSMDQGFEESLVHTGGGFCQPAGPPDDSYFNPWLLHNGERIQTDGYCSDVYVDYLLEFFARTARSHSSSTSPSTAPISRFRSPNSTRSRTTTEHETRRFSPARPPPPGVPEETSAVYGMVQNIDDNVGRVLKTLDELKLAENTIVIFMTDNGPNGMSYDAGMKMCKGSVYEGGIRTAFFIRWPARLKAGQKVTQPAAHIDVMPTLLDACNVPCPENLKLDGRSFLPLAEGKSSELPERTLFFQWHRGDSPCSTGASRRDRTSTNSSSQMEIPPRDADPAQVNFELYDMRNDPLEMNDIAAEKPEVVVELRSQYETWLADVARDHGYEAPRILIGTEAEPLTMLTRQDWRGPLATWAPKGLGYWELAVPRDGKFRITADLDAPKKEATVKLRIQTHEKEIVLTPGENPGSRGPGSV